MEYIINNIIKQNKNILGENPEIEKINVGFTNTIYKVNNSFIIKICTNKENEEKFKKEIEFYNSNKENKLIPKLYSYSTNKNDIPYFYEILEKLEGETLFNVWHTLDEIQKEEIIKQLCTAMKEFHNFKGEYYNWEEYLNTKFIESFTEVKNKQIINNEQISIIEKAYTLFNKYLESKQLVLIHNDLHFDNIFINNGKIKIIDFERSMYAPIDFELDILYRMIRKPWKFASEETEKYTNKEDYLNIMSYIEKYYPELLNVKHLYKRLAIYDIVYFLEQLTEYPKNEELKNDIISAAKIISL